MLQKKNLCVCVNDGIGKFSSKLCKNKKDTDISLYQIYLPNLRANIFKYSINFIYLKKKSLLASTMASKLRYLLQVVLMGFLFKLLNATITLAFYSSLVLHIVLLVTCSTMPNT